MNIKLVKLAPEYKAQFMDMMEEWTTDIEKNNTNHSPWMIFRNDYHDFDYYLENLEVKEETGRMVPDSTFFCLDMDRNIFVGAVNIRKYLNSNISITGGHIGDGIRPSERKKGYATAMIGLALEECRKLGMNKVLMTCDKDNIGSAKSIINNGGVFEFEVEDDGELENRYWITLHEEEIETDRMILKRVMPGDYEDMAAWTLDERVYKFLLGTALKDPKDALSFLYRDDPNSKTHYVMIERSKEDGHAIGIIGCVYAAEKDTWEVSWSARFDDWGKGYTTEGISALMDYVRKQYGAHRFEAECAAENIASSKVAEKLGMTYVADSEYEKHDKSVMFKSKIYRVDT